MSLNTRYPLNRPPKYKKAHAGEEQSPFLQAACADGAVTIFEGHEVRLTSSAHSWEYCGTGVQKHPLFAFSSPSIELQLMSWFSGLCRAGYLLNKLAMKAKFSFGFPRTTSVAVTNCRQPSRSACCSMHSARWTSSFSCSRRKWNHQPHSTASHCTQELPRAHVELHVRLLKQFLVGFITISFLTFTNIRSVFSSGLYLQSSHLTPMLLQLYSM